MVLPVPVRLFWRPESLPRIFATPKSRTFTCSSPSGRRVTMMLSGFRSRCTMPLAWASTSAFATCAIRVAHRRSDSCGVSVSSAFKLTPFTSSIAR